MKCPQLSLRRNAFCLSLHMRHQSYQTLMSSFLHQMMFQRVFLLKKQGSVAAKKLESLLEFFSFTLMSPWSLSSFFFIFLSSHSRHFFSAPCLQMKLCLMCRPRRKQFSQRVTSSQCTHLQTVSLVPISLSWQPSQQQLYSFPTFLLMSCYLIMYYFYLIQRMISGVFQSRHSGHFTTPLFLISCLAHWLKHSRWNVFLHTVAHDVVASHFTICMWQIAHRLSSSSSSSSRMTLRRGILILVYFKKSSTLLSWILRLAMMYLSSLSSYLCLKMSGWSSGMQKISVRAQSVWMQWRLLVVSHEHFSSLPIVILNLVPWMFSRMKLVRPVMPTRQNFCLRCSSILTSYYSNCFVFFLFGFDIQLLILLDHLDLFWNISKTPYPLSSRSSYRHKLSPMEPQVSLNTNAQLIPIAPIDYFSFVLRFRL